MNPKKLFRGTLESIPASFWGRAFPKDALTFFYHVVSDEDLPHLQHYRYKTTAQFEADVRYIAQRHGFLRYEELRDRRLRGKTTDLNGGLVTFDDGFVECATTAAPILQKHGGSAIFFVTTDLIDNHHVFYESRIALLIDAAGRLADEDAEQVLRDLETCRDLPGYEGLDAREPARTRLARGRIATPPSPHHRRLICWLLNLGQEHERLVDRIAEAVGLDAEAHARERPLFMSSDQVRDLASAGFTVGAHGTRHRKLQRMDDEELEREIVEACDRVRQITGQKTVPFAFPHSGRGIDRMLLASILGRHPFVELLFDTGGLRDEIPFIVHRVGADTPEGSSKEGTNLPFLLRRAWARRPAWQRAPAPSTWP